MGCDIHAAIVDPQWGYVIPLEYEPRNYTFFGILAGVRGDCENPVADGRGYPSIDKPSLEGDHVIAYDFEGGIEVAHYLGDHSYSYCYTKELSNAIDRTYEEDGSNAYGLDYWRAVHALMVAINNGRRSDSLMLVFGFDS